MTMPDHDPDRIVWMPDPVIAERDMQERWKTCPVTIAAAAMLDDAQLDHLATWLEDDRAFMDQLGFEISREDREDHGIEGFRRMRAAQAPDPTEPRSRLWSGIGSIVFHAWADGRFFASIEMGAAIAEADGSPIRQVARHAFRYADATLVMASTSPGEMYADMPETLVAAAAGQPMTGLLAHPIFDGLDWAAEQPEPSAASAGRSLYLRGPAVDMPLGVHPGTRLATLARLHRPKLIGALIRMTPGVD